MRLLIVAASASRRSAADLLPAWQRYQGPAWRTFAALIAAHPPLVSDLDLYALSAEHGLIPAIQPIPARERLFDPAHIPIMRSLIHMSWVRACAHAVIAWGGYQATLIVGGAGYQALLPDPPPAGSGILTRASGSIRTQIQQLTAWLLHAR